MLAGLKLFKTKKSYCETTLGAGAQGCSLKQAFWKTSQKLQENKSVRVSF